MIQYIRLTKNEMASVKRGYRNRKPTARTTWAYDLGAEIATEHSRLSLDEGLRFYGYHTVARG